MKTDGFPLRAARLAVLSSFGLVVAAGCGSGVVDPNVRQADEEGRAFLQSLDEPTAQQGEPFVVRIVAFDQGATGSSQPPSSTRLTPSGNSGLEVVGLPVILDGELRFTLVGRKEGIWTATASAPGSGYDDAQVSIEIRRTELEVTSDRPHRSLEGGGFVPVLPGETATVRFTVLGSDGCPRPGAATWGDIDDDEWDVAIRYSREFGPITAVADGCPDAGDGALEADITYSEPEDGPSQGSVAYTIAADPEISARISILGVPRFETPMVEPPAPVTGTFTRTNQGSCQFVPGTVGLEWQIGEAAEFQLRLTTPDGSAYTQTGRAGVEYTFVSGATTMADDVQAVESLALRFDLIRPGDLLAVGVSGNSRITLSRSSTGEEICDVTADVSATAPLPLARLDYLFDPGR